MSSRNTRDSSHAQNPCREVGLLANQLIVVVAGLILGYSPVAVADSVIPLPDALDYIEETIDRGEDFLGDNISAGLNQILGTPEVQDLIKTTNQVIDLYDRGRDLYDRGRNLYDRIVDLPATISNEAKGQIRCRVSDYDLDALRKCLKSLSRSLPEESENSEAGKKMGQIGLREIYVPDLGVLGGSDFATYHDFLNLYDEETARLIAARYLYSQGKEWLEGNVKMRQKNALERQKILKQLAKKIQLGSKEKITQKVLKAELKAKQDLAAIGIAQIQKMDSLESKLIALLEMQAAQLQLQSNLAEDFGELNRHNRLSRETVYEDAQSFNLHLPSLWLE